MPLPELLDPGPLPPADTDRSCGEPTGRAEDSGVEENLQEEEEALACGVVEGDVEVWWRRPCTAAGVAATGPGVVLPPTLALGVPTGVGAAEVIEGTVVAPVLAAATAAAAKSAPFCRAAVIPEGV